MLHKMIRINEKKLGYSLDRLQLILNIPVLAAAAALIIIINVVFRAAPVTVDMYRLIVYIVAAAVTYSFVVSLIITLIAVRSIPSHKRHTYIELSDGVAVFSRFEKTVREDGGKKTDHIKMWVMKLSDIEDARVRHGKLEFIGNARYFCLPAEWLRYTTSPGGHIDFERQWNNEYGGEKIHKVTIKDDYTFAERIIRRVLFCADRERVDEKRRAEYRQRMLELAGSINRKKGLTRKYQSPLRMPREGIKERKW